MSSLVNEISAVINYLDILFNLRKSSKICSAQLVIGFWKVSSASHTKFSCVYPAYLLAGPELLWQGTFHTGVHGSLGAKQSVDAQSFHPHSFSRDCYLSSSTLTRTLEKKKEN